MTAELFLSLSNCGLQETLADVISSYPPECLCGAGGGGESCEHAHVTGLP